MRARCLNRSECVLHWYFIITVMGSTENITAQLEQTLTFVVLQNPQGAEHKRNFSYFLLLEFDSQLFHKDTVDADRSHQ